MRIVTLVVVSGLVLVSCGGEDPSAGAPSDSAAIYAASLVALVGDDNTFGGDGNPFTELLVQTSLDPNAGFDAPSAEVRPLTDEERATIEEALSPLAPVRWIDDPAEWRTQDLRPTIEGAAILSVGGITFDDNGALVPMAMWCGGLCGTWFNYRVAESDTGWHVVDVEGPVAVS
jgi:hypothetical protein